MRPLNVAICSLSTDNSFLPTEMKNKSDIPPPRSLAALKLPSLKTKKKQHAASLPPPPPARMRRSPTPGCGPASRPCPPASGPGPFFGGYLSQRAHSIGGIRRSEVCVENPRIRNLARYFQTRFLTSSLSQTTILFEAWIRRKGNKGNFSTQMFSVSNHKSHKDFYKVLPAPHQSHEL